MCLFACYPDRYVCTGIHATFTYTGTSQRQLNLVKQLLGFIISCTLKKYGCLIGDLTCLGETEAAVYTIKWHSLPRVNQRNVVHLWLWICNLTESLTFLIITSCSLHTKFLCVLEIKCWCNLDPPPPVFHKQKEQKFQFYTYSYSPQIITNLKIILEKNKITLQNKSGW